MYIPIPVREHPRVAIVIVAACAILGIIAFALAQDSANRSQDSQRKATASHWAAAGLKNPVTTLKDGGDKRTVGSVGKCIVTVEGFTTYTSVMVSSNGGNPTVKQEFTFRSTDQKSADAIAYDYIGRLPEIATYCLV